MPRTAVAGAKRYPLGLRTTLEMRQGLEAAARESGRSLSAEVENRLEKSLNYDEVFGGRELRRAAFAMATSFAIGGQYSAGEGVPFEKWDEGTRISAIANVVISLIKFCTLSDQAAKLLIAHLRGQIESLIVQRRAEQEGRL
jgi:hypothetical protein